MEQNPIGRVRMINVNNLIDVLKQFKNQNVEFIDLHCFNTPEEDSLRIIKSEQSDSEEVIVSDKITSDDLIRLIKAS